MMSEEIKSIVFGDFMEVKATLEKIQAAVASSNRYVEGSNFELNENKINVFCMFDIIDDLSKKANHQLSEIEDKLSMIEGKTGMIENIISNF